MVKILGRVENKRGTGFSMVRRRKSRQDLFPIGSMVGFQTSA
jgi:hypothetical protein